MARPQSIVQFDMVFFIVLATSIVVQALTWNQMVAQAAAMEGAAEAGLASPAAVLAVNALGHAINLLLWYLISRRGSAVAKWIYTALFGLSVAGLLLTLAAGSLLAGPTGIATVALTLLNAIAVWLLFRPDAAAWFGRQPAP